MSVYGATFTVPEKTSLPTCETLTSSLTVIRSSPFLVRYEVSQKVFKFWLLLSSKGQVSRQDRASHSRKHIFPWMQTCSATSTPAPRKDKKNKEDTGGNYDSVKQRWVLHQKQNLHDSKLIRWIPSVKILNQN